MATNLITNPGIETDTSGWAQNGSGVVTRTRDTGEFYSGAASLHIQSDGAAANQGTYFSSPLIYCRYGDTLLLSVAAKAAASTTSMRLAVRIGNASDSFIDETWSTISVTTSWQVFTYSKKLTARLSRIARFKLYAAGTTALDVYMDDAALYDLSSPFRTRSQFQLRPGY